MKKWSLAHICAYLSLAISFTLLVLWCCNIGGFTVVSLDSFVGVIVALLAIIVTLAVGWQILNSIEIKSKIEELSSLKDELEQLKKTTEQQNNKSQHLISFHLGIDAYNGKDYLNAFRFFIISLHHSMLLDNPMNVEIILYYLDDTENKIVDGNNYEFEMMERIREYDKGIRKSSFYNTIKSRYEHVYNDFNSKVKEKI